MSVSQTLPTNINNMNIQIINQAENISTPFFNFFIFTDTGSCIFRASSKNNANNFNDIGAMQGIISALFFSSLDLKCNFQCLTTELGCLGYKPFIYKDNILLLALLFPNYYADENLCNTIIQNILDYLYHICLIHIGITDLFSFKTSNDMEKLRRYLEIILPSIQFILNNHSNLNFLLCAEKKYEIDKDLIYSVKYYLERLKSKLKVDLICLTLKNTVIWASSDWLNLDIMDRILFLVISELYGDGDFNEIPIYFSSTPLEDEGLGKVPYKLFLISLIKDTKILILSDNECTINKIDMNVFDDFFVNRIINMKNISIFHNTIIDNCARSIVIYNSILKTYKVMLDENLVPVFEKFILNNCFSNILFDNLKENSQEMTDEFFMKDDSNFTFYFSKVDSIIFLMLFHKETTFDDINAIKLILKASKDKFDTKENYKDSNEIKDNIN